jgi:hypothetical protein
MGTSGFSGYVLRISAAAVLLAGCGGASQSFAPAGPPSRLAHPGGIAALMRPEASKKGLVYVSTLFGDLEVYTWPALAPVGTISGLDVPYTLCTDATGDVWVPDFGAHIIYEYAHGGSAPIHSLIDNYGTPEACSSDPTTGNLAVGDYSSPGSGPGNVLVFKKARRGPAEYAVPNLIQCFFVSYDNQGNLFANGIDASRRPVLAELPKGGSSFEQVTVEPIVSYPGSLQWDGKYLAEQDSSTNVIYQFAVADAKAVLKGVTMLDEGGYMDQLWITGATKRHPQGTAVVGSNYVSYAFEVWNYPTGGDPTAIVGGLSSSPEGITVSPDARRYTGIAHGLGERTHLTIRSGFGGH